MSRFAALTLFLVIAIALLTGCAGMQEAYAPPPPTPLLPPNGVTDAPLPEAADGSLWLHGQSQSLWTDPVGRRLHDIVFVNVREESTSTQTAETELKRQSNLDFGIRNLLGLENEINTINDADTSDGVDPAHMIRANTQNDYTAEGETLRRNTLMARVSTQVVEVFPNGNLRLFGTQAVAINNENQLLTVEGIARPWDVGADNAIDSYLLAEARIEYTGRGVVSDLQRPGWGARVLDWVWPF